MKVVSNCIVCQKPLSGKQRSFCSTECKNDHFLSYDVLKNRALERKSRLIGASGGSCLRCGYSSSLDALSFYDKNGETLHIDTNVLANSNYGKLEKRLEGSQVLCRNCYEEIHADGDCRVAVAPRNDGELLKKLSDNLAQIGLKPGQTIVLGVSGGVDSVTMLDLFAKADLKLNLIVAHMNHGLRAEAKNDEKLAQELAAKYRVTFVSKELPNYSDILENMRVVNSAKSQNREEYFRNERRKFLLDVTAKKGATFLALAHNADDQAETFIMNAVRGSGPAGLGAMSLSEDNIIRPLLNISRLEIESYARQNKLVWHEDETNKDISYNRNYVRHCILPLLKRLNPEYLSAIGRTAQLQRHIDEHLKEEAFYVIARSASDAAISSVNAGKDCFVPRNDGGVGVSAEHLRRLDKPLLYEVLGLLYGEAKGNRQNLSLVHLTIIEELIATSAGTKTLDLPGEVTVKRSYDKLDFYAKLAHNVPSAPSAKKLKMGTQKFGDWEITVSSLCHPCESEDLLQGERERSLGLRPGMTKRESNKNEIIIDAETLPNLLVRTRKPGDKIASIGLIGTKKLQDLFADAKIDRAKRATWPVLVTKNTNEILLVSGLAKVKSETKTKKLLKINIVEATDESNESNQKE